MSKGSKLGWILFGVIVLVRFLLNDRIPDDATTVAMKRAGIHHYVIGGGFSVIGLALLWLVREGRRNDKLYRDLHRLKEVNARGEAELLITRRR